MNDSEHRQPPVPVATCRRRFAEMLAASAFAVAQPIYVRIATQNAFLLDAGTTPARLYMLTIVIYVGLPLLLCLIEWLASRRSARLSGALHQLSVAVMALLFCLLVGRNWLLSIDRLNVAGVSGPLTIVGSSIAAAAVGGLIHQRWMRQLLLLAACGSVLFPIQFLRSGAATAILSPLGPPLVAEAGRPAPVVLLIFDEFSGLSLWNEHREIDAVRYPNFARLAASSTWYRNASTVHARTGFAVPSLLTGRFPLADRGLMLADAPQNLFTLLQSAGYTTAAFEPVSRLFPPPSRTLHAGVPLSSWCTMMGRALTSVYAHALMPTDLPIPLPAIPAAWHGLADDPTPPDQRALRTGVFREAYDVDAQFEHFLDCLPHDAAPTLSVLHAISPHCPWQFLPDGERYTRVNDCSGYPLANVGGFQEDWLQDEVAVRQAWQRYLLQVGDIDRRVGIVLDRLDAAGILDETLIVVAGDHGVSFRPGHSRRVPDGDNLADILSVPLFIKLPGQRAGAISDRNVESIDVLPTIAAALEIKLPLPVDGDSLLDESIPARARKTLQFDSGSTVASAEFPERVPALLRMLETFGSGSQNDRLWTPLGPRMELIGHRVDEFLPATSGAVTVELVDSDDSAIGPRATCLFLGSVFNPAATSEPLQLAIGSRGRIIGTSQTTIDPRLPGRWSCFVTGLDEPITTDDVQVFVIRSKADGTALEECEISLVGVRET